MAELVIQDTIGSYESRVRSFCRELCKVELHLHLDGSLSEGFIRRRAAERKIEIPEGSLRAKLIREKQEALQRGTHKQKANGNWSGFDFCNQFLQTASELREATCEVAERLYKEHNVWVLELRFCPTLHTQEGLTEKAAVQAVIDGFRDAERVCPRLRGGIILCALRSRAVSHFQDVFELAREFMESGTVIGGDVAGDELSFPLTPFVDVLKQATKAGLPLTIHAGEWLESGKSSIASAIGCGAQRIGHALVLGSDTVCIRKVVDHDVAVEVCLTSNVGGGAAKCDSYENHPVRKMAAAGVRIAGFNSDNLLLSGTLEYAPSPTAELERAILKCKLTPGDVRASLICALESTFDRRVATSDAYRSEFVSCVDSLTSKYGFAA